MYGGLEAGGTKLICVVGTGPDDLVAVERIALTAPAETLAAAVAFFRNAHRGSRPLEALGIGSFGPVESRPDNGDFGHITATPKPGWSGVDMVGPFRALGIPVGFDTDVNAAVLAEARWGAARGVASAIYLTIGTGVGGAGLVDGHLVAGLGHPEMGHIAVERLPGDGYVGGCPYHGDCLEGMIAGPALAERFGSPAETLRGEELARAVDLVAHYLACGVRSLAYTLAPERVVVGGGVSFLQGLFPAARRALAAQLRGYPGHPEHAAEAFLVPAGLGAMAGPIGTLLLAERAIRRPVAHAGAA